MDALFTKIGTAVFANKADKSLKSVSRDVQSLANSATEGATNFVNRLRGKLQTSVYDLLENYGLPRGIIPKDILTYTFDEASGELVLKLQENCEVKYPDGSINRFAKEVVGVLTRSSLVVKQGMKTKLVFWLVVTSITADDSASDKKNPSVYYTTAGVKRARPLASYTTARTSVSVEEF